MRVGNHFCCGCLTTVVVVDVVDVSWEEKDIFKALEEEKEEEEEEEER
jgi:hypothetical protein